MSNSCIPAELSDDGRCSNLLSVTAERERAIIDGGGVLIEVYPFIAKKKKKRLI